MLCSEESHSCSKVSIKIALKVCCFPSLANVTLIPLTLKCHFLFFFFLSFWPHPTACGILVPQPAIEPRPPALEGRVLTTGLPGKSRYYSSTNKIKLKNEFCPINAYIEPDMFHVKWGMEMNFSIWLSGIG